MTTLVSKRFVQATLTGSAALLYTVPASTTSVLRDIQLCNFGGADKRAYIYLVKAGDSPANASLILPGTSIPGDAGDANTAFYRHFFPMATGDMIYGYAETTGCIAMQASGVECTGGFQTITPTRFVQVDLAGSLPSALYTVGAGKAAILKDFILANHDSVQRTVTVDFKKSGGSVGNDSKFLYQWPIAAGVQQQFRLSCVLGAGDEIYAFADSASKVSFNLGGGLVTL